MASQSSLATTRASSSFALITGGSRGLGRATALALAARGVDSIITYQSNQAEANKVVAAVEQAGARAVALRLDTGDSGTFAGFADQVRGVLSDRRVERFDFLVNNAGTSHHAALVDVTEEDLDTLYRVHVKGVFFLPQTLLPLINDGGRIVNISSALARVAYPGNAAYGAMKGAVEVLTRYMAKELGPRGIVANTVAPGAIATDFSGGMVRDNPDVNKAVAAMSPLNRVGQPDDIGQMIAALLSEENRWVNAQRIEVSGGAGI
jgi:NAD(P)-dependent dehydrogenase (short-subunit alcohol dehydrogenase family)